jgi:hypothetical protein
LQAVAERVDHAKQQGGQVELWEFQGFNPGVTERVRNGLSHNWQDVGHFDRALGNQMLDLMFHRAAAPEEGSVPPLGVSLGAEQVPELYARFLQDRERFIAANPWFHKDLDALRKAP